jgi:hypothetical protein
MFLVRGMTFFQFTSLFILVVFFWHVILIVYMLNWQRTFIFKVLLESKNVYREKDSFFFLLYLYFSFFIFIFSDFVLILFIIFIFILFSVFVLIFCYNIYYYGLNIF